MRALSILQPWAWLIVRPDLTDELTRTAARVLGLVKDVENRTWYTPFRGRFLVHAGKTYSRRKHQEYSEAIDDMFGIRLPAFEAIALGAIVGEASVHDCVRSCPSRWKADDQWGFLLNNQKALTTPVPWKGQLGFFDIPYVDGVVQTTGSSDR